MQVSCLFEVKLAWFFGFSFKMIIEKIIFSCFEEVEIYLHFLLECVSCIHCLQALDKVFSIFLHNCRFWLIAFVGLYQSIFHQILENFLDAFPHANDGHKSFSSIHKVYPNILNRNVYCMIFPSFKISTVFYVNLDAYVSDLRGLRMRTSNLMMMKMKKVIYFGVCCHVDEI